MRRLRSIRTTLYLIVLTIMLPALGIIIHSSIDMRERALRMTQERAEDLVSTLADRNRQITENTLSLLHAVSHVEDIRRQKAHTASDLFRNILKRSPNYDDFLLVNAYATLVTSAFSGKVFTLDEHPEFQIALEQKRFAYGRVLSNGPAGDPVQYFAAPVMDAGGEVDAVIMGGMKISRYAQDITAASLPTGGQIRLYDSVGNCVFAWPQRDTAPQEMQADWRFSQERQADADSLLFSPSAENERLIIYHRTRLADVPRPYMTILFSIPPAAVKAVADARFYRDLTFLTLSALLAFALVGLLGRRLITRPVRALIDTARKIRSGDLSARLDTEGMENEMGELARTFNAMAVSLEIRDRALISAKIASDEDNRAKSEFLTNMSHEIRTPMSAVIGLAYLILKTPLDERQRGYISKIYTAANTLQGVINDILDFGRIESGDLRIERVPFRLEDIFDNVAVVIGQRLAENDLEVIFRTGEHVPAVLMGDPLRLNQILTNIASNAAKFTGEGEIQISCDVDDGSPLPSTLPGTPADTLPEAPLSPAQPEDGLLPASSAAQASPVDENEELLLRFVIKDTGIGISQEEQTKLFQAFSQADSSATRKFGGTGLGLTITRRLVELMGGRIALYSERGKGTIVTFTCRFGIGEDDQPEQACAVPSGDAHILVVDDNPVARAVLAEMLQSLSYAVDTAVSAPEALAMLRQAEERSTPYRLVFMDWRMPEMDGVEATYAVRQGLGLAEPPEVIIVTAFGRGDIAARAERAGASSVLYKPISRTLLRRSMADSVAHAKPEAAAPRPAEEKAPVSTDRPLLGLHILVVEDNMINMQIAVELLEDAGARVTQAENGRIGLQKIEAQPVDPSDRFDLVLTDLQMPEMDGYELTTRVREQARFNPLPLIAMTAHAMVEERRRCAELGMNDYITKPLDIEHFFATILQWAQPKTAQPQSPLTPQTPEPPAAGVAIQDALREELGALPPNPRQGHDAPAPTIPANNAERCLPEAREGGGNSHRRSGHFPQAESETAAPDVTKAEAAAPDAAAQEPEAQSAPAQPMDALEWLRDQGLRTDVALARLAGNTRLYKKLLVQFHARQGASATDCQEALAAGDAEKANRIAHTLKGLAATIGADDLTACALALESASTSLPLSAEEEEAAVRCFAELGRIIALLGEVLPELEDV